jgi:HTH-type transcriptional regulator/antitoxin HipB
MATLKTPADLGNVILQRRKALGWDQARLAHEAGVSRQWIIEIEKGKPRAELQLVLRALNVLGIELDALHREAPKASGGRTLDLADVDHIVEHSRAGPDNTFGSWLDALHKPSTALSVLEKQQEKYSARFNSAFEEQQRLPPDPKATSSGGRKGKK